ncbi:MAG: hypothetical protein CUN55_13060 [Phototrophicales bacterium]|nr:MAG: hypothetical protein CUN55_13060 [Phototrophicales bacterium]
MSLLTITHFLLETSWIYPLMLLSTATMGAGFGIVLSLSNVYAYDLFKGREDAAVTAVQIIMGLGLVVGAPMLGVFIELEMWWGAPIFILLSLGGMMLWLFFLPLKLSIELDDASEAQKGHLNMRLVLYALLVFLYGASEATFSTWSTTFLELEQGYSTSQAAFGLSIFWLTIAIGRVLFAFSVHRINAGLFYLISPITIAVSFLFLPFTKTLFLSYAALILAGLGCSFFFPYSISRASAENLHQTTFASGILVASLQFGIGVSALVVGTLNDLDVISLPDLLSFSSVYAIGMTIIVVYLIRHRDDGVLPERR